MKSRRFNITSKINSFKSFVV